MDIQQPHPPLQRAHSSSAPAAMASPIFPPSSFSHLDDTHEDETCRICKSESTPHQPLFHPCRCSGSIKYVHQDCLMEWLSRSQKKHCELCKTPFRFTKLYEGGMPEKLPLGLFVKHILLHGLRTLRTWGRGVVVGMVWLGVLPWVMRHIWGGLFWVADGGWWMHPRDAPHPALGAAISASHIAPELYAMYPANALQKTYGDIRMSPAGGMVEPLHSIYRLVMEQAHNNATFKDIGFKDVLRALFYPAAFESYGLPAGERNESWPITLEYPIRSPPMILPQNSDSILGGFTFLQNLTKNERLNGLIITVLEGQIITIVVVVCFILIFLIREWVVQQQPGINVGAGFDAQVAGGERDGERQVEEAREEMQRLMRILEEQNERERVENRRGWRRDPREEAGDGRPATPPIARRDTSDEALRAEWRAQEEEARQNGMHFVHRQGAAPNDRLPEADDQPEELDENGDLISVIGVTRQPTTEYTLRGKSHEEKAAVVHSKLLEHVRFIIPGMSGKITEFMIKEDGVNGVLKYIDYEDEIHQKLTDTLLKHNSDLVTEGKPTILTKEKGKEHILKALVGQMADDHHARDEENAVKVFMSLDVLLLLRILALPDAAREMIRDLDEWEGPATEEEKLDWAESHMANAQHIPDNWEDEEINDEARVGEREKAYGEGLRARRESCGSSVYDESEEEGPYVASRPDGGLMPERRSYEAKLAARLKDGENRTAEAGHPKTPFKFNFNTPDIEPENSGEQGRRGGDAAGPAPRERPDSQPSTVGGIITPPTDEEIDEARKVSPEDAAHGVVGYTVSGRPMISDEEMMRRLDGSPNASNADDEGWTSDNEPTAFGQEMGEEGIATELRTEGEIVETERLEAAAEAARVEARAPQTLGGRIAQLLWGDVETEEEMGMDDEHIVDDLAAEAPFVPVNHGHQEHHDHHHDHLPDLDLQHDHDHDHDDEEEAPPLQQALAGFADDLDNMDPEAIDEAEDFDGIMELVGMRGPIFTLVQNCLIGIILLAITIFVGVWIPYIVGKITLLLVANPISAIKLPLRLIFKLISIMQDLALIFFGGMYYTFIKGISIIIQLFGKKDFLAEKNSGIVGLGAVDAVLYAGSALERIIGDFINICAPDANNLPTFSAAAHESLIYLRSSLSSMLGFSSWVMVAREIVSELGIYGALWLGLTNLFALLSTALLASAKWLIHLPALLAKPETWVITLSSPPRQAALDLALSHWNAIDRTYAILAGYGTFISLGAAYISKGSPFSTSESVKQWEALIIDILNQAGGVLKVILIISIEMLAFPLYCGLLLDVATLPLFEGATVWSRVAFGLESPATSAFVHWFVGTCYMFHFALFVSMCRKILRRGTLYFIRDPDDPTFHPVRDVLERNIATQLRKIGFSALVYGALVLVCLGGVVWSLSFSFTGVIPIRWSSNEPVLEFPIDLLFYNFLMPLAVKYFRPSKGLHAMYKWWFIQSAHYLRLSHFLLGDRRLEEELWPAESNSDTERLQDMEDEELREIIEAQAPTPPDAALSTGPQIARKEEAQKEWLNHGRYVRAPASDMVRIPKHKSVFLEVNARNERLDGLPEVGDDLHGKHKKEIEMVYHPPRFWTRVGGFVLGLWVFAAVTGCGATLIPLVIGRRIFARVLPEEVERNDVYALAMGANLLFGSLYLAYYSRGFVTRSYASIIASDPVSALRTTAATSWKVAKLMATYAAFIGLIPALLAMTMEAYVIMPLHSFVIPNEQHTVHFIQSWTLGLLMTNLGRRWVLSEEYGYGGSRAALAMRRVVRRGYGDLDMALAWRGFILPIVLVAGAALVAPMIGASLAVKLGLVSESVKLYRNAYPFTLALLLLIIGMMSAIGKLKQWRMSIRDEVYLIGERLHNYTDKGKGRARERRMVGRMGV